MKYIHEMREVIGRVSYPGLAFVVKGTSLGDCYLQVEATVPDVCGDGAARVMHGRKWRLSSYMTDSELVQTALMAVLAWLEHEAREQFLYKGRPVLGPHFSVDRLWELADGANLDPRVDGA